MHLGWNTRSEMAVIFLRWHRSSANQYLFAKCRFILKILARVGASSQELLLFVLWCLWELLGDAEGIKVMCKTKGGWDASGLTGDMKALSMKAVILSPIQRGFPKRCSRRPPRTCQPVFLLDMGQTSRTDDRWLKCQHSWQADSTERGSSNPNRISNCGHTHVHSCCMSLLPL